MTRSILDVGLGIPSFSFKEMKRGTEFEGIQIGEMVEEQQTDPNTGKPLFFNRRGTPPGVEDPDPNAPRQQGIITLMTTYRNWEHVSNRFLDRAESDPDAVDDGRRKLYIKGALNKPTLLGGLILGLKAAKVAAPEHGSVHRCKLIKKTPLANGGEASDFAYTYIRPTPETLAKVEEWLPKEEPALSVLDAAREPDDEPPPF